MSLSQKDLVLAVRASVPESNIAAFLACSFRTAVRLRSTFIGRGFRGDVESTYTLPFCTIVESRW